MYIHVYIYTCTSTDPHSLFNALLKNWEWPGDEATSHTNTHLLHTIVQVQSVIEDNRKELLERRYTFPVGKLMGAVRERLKWADGKLVKDTIEKQVRYFTM